MTWVDRTRRGARVHAARKVGIDLARTQINAARQRVPDGEFHVQAGELLDLVATNGQVEKFR